MGKEDLILLGGFAAVAVLGTTLWHGWIGF